jgi:hypothetical protein
MIQFHDADTIRTFPVESHRTKLFARFMHDESGATAIEYGLIAAGISLATSQWSTAWVPTSTPSSPT